MNSLFHFGGAFSDTLDPTHVAFSASRATSPFGILCILVCSKMAAMIAYILQPLPTSAFLICEQRQKTDMTFHSADWFIGMLV